MGLGRHVSLSFACRCFVCTWTSKLWKQNWEHSVNLHITFYTGQEKTENCSVSKIYNMSPVWEYLQGIAALQIGEIVTTLYIFIDLQSYIQSFIFSFYKYELIFKLAYACIYIHLCEELIWDLYMRCNHLSQVNLWWGPMVFFLKSQFFV